MMDQALGKFRDALNRGITVATPAARKATKLAGQAAGIVVSRIQSRVSTSHPPAQPPPVARPPRTEAPPPAPAPPAPEPVMEHPAPAVRVTPAKVAGNVAKRPPSKKPLPRESPSGKLPPRRRAPANRG